MPSIPAIFQKVEKQLWYLKTNLLEGEKDRDFIFEDP